MMLGWGIGIESNSKYPRMALEQAIDKITIPVVQAESALNVSSAGSAGNIMNNQRTSNKTNVTNNYEGFMKGAKLIVREEADIDRIAKELLRMKQIAEGQRGMRHIGMDY